MKNFDYTAPGTVREAVALLAEKNGRARALAGGTDLLVQMRVKHHEPERVVDVKRIPELNELSYGPRRGLRIGAAVPCHRIYSDEGIVERYPGLIDSAAIIGGIQIQGRASFGGNLCNSSPSADTIPALIAYSAECDYRGTERQTPGPGRGLLHGTGSECARTGRASRRLPDPSGPQELGGALSAVHSPQ